MMLLDNIRPELKEDIRNLSKKHNISLFSKMSKEKDRSNFESLLTEALFGLYFDKIGTDLQYNSKVFDNNESTPDFLFSKNDQDIVVEVFRINESNKKNINNETIFHIITIKSNKLEGDNGRITEKSRAYGRLVSENNYPFLICLYLCPTSGLDAPDLYHSLYGPSVDNSRVNQIFDGYFPNSSFHNHIDGLYYRNTLIKNTVSGIILRNPDQSYTYFHNFNSNNKLNSDNIEYFLKIQYTDK